MTTHENTEDDEEGGRGGDVADPTTYRVRLAARRCDTCIFRPGNLMHLQPGRVKAMVESCIEKEGHVTCHKTLTYSGNDLPPAVCRGFEQHARAAAHSMAVAWLRMTGLVTLVDPATGEQADADYRALPPLADDD